MTRQNSSLYIGKVCLDTDQTGYFGEDTSNLIAPVFKMSWYILTIQNSMVLFSVQGGDAKLLNEEEIGTLPTGLLEIRSFGNFSPTAL